MAFVVPLFVSNLQDFWAEESRRPIVNYDQEIQGGHINMRGKLVNWMAELVYGFNLWDNILYLAVSYVDLPCGFIC